MITLNILFKALISTVLVSACAYGLIVVSSLWLFAKPSVRVGQVISISAPKVNQVTNEQTILIDLMSGWAYPESWGAWSIADIATVSFPKPDSNPKSLILEARALVSSKHPQQIVKVMINGQLRTTAVLNKGDDNKINIPLEATDFTGERLVIEFQLPNLVSPTALDIGKDDRKLAIGLKSARYQ